MFRTRFFFIVAFAALALASADAALTAVEGSTAAGAATPDAALLGRYEPLLQFDPLEQFLPTKVQSFVTDADLEQLTGGGTWMVAATHPAPDDLPGPARGRGD
jgi:hypothetical protein